MRPYVFVALIWLLHTHIPRKILKWFDWMNWVRDREDERLHHFQSCYLVCALIPYMCVLTIRINLTKVESESEREREICGTNKNTNTKFNWLAYNRNEAHLNPQIAASSLQIQFSACTFKIKHENHNEKCFRHTFLSKISEIIIK